MNKPSQIKMRVDHAGVPHPEQVTIGGCPVEGDSTMPKNTIKFRRYSLITPIQNYDDVNVIRKIVSNHTESVGRFIDSEMIAMLNGAHNLFFAGLPRKELSRWDRIRNRIISRWYDFRYAIVAGVAKLLNIEIGGGDDW